MIRLSLSPQEYETIIIALNLAITATKKHDAKFMSGAFENVLHEIAPTGTKSKEVGKGVDKN